MRYLNKSEVHKQAVQILRNSKNGMSRTASRLAACNVDKQIDSMLKCLKENAWSLPDDVVAEWGKPF